MWKKSAAAAVLAVSCLAAQPAGAIVTLDSKGTLFIPYYCDQTKLVRTEIDSLPHKYTFEGPCTVAVKFGGVAGEIYMNWPVRVTASYDGAWAWEDFELEGGTKIQSRTRCENDPFQPGGSGSCRDEGRVFSMSSQFLIAPTIKLYGPDFTPIMVARASPEKIEAARTGQAGSPLTVGSGKPDLSDWNPFSQEPGAPATIRVSAPRADTRLPASTAYKVSLAQSRRSSQPASALLQIGRLEEFPKTGDIAPPPGKTHWWRAKWTGMVDWNKLPLRIGRSRLTRGLTQAGLYRVRAMAQGRRGDQGGWTPWRVYCLGSNVFCGKTAQIGRIGKDALKAMLLKQMGKISRVPRARPLSNKAR